MPEDLQHLRALHQLLLALNDPLVSRSKLQMLTASMPVLAARVIHQAKTKWPAIDSLSEALQRIGNRGLERALLEFLEDLTVYKADLEEKQKGDEARSATASPAAAKSASVSVTPEKRPTVAPNQRMSVSPGNRMSITPGNRPSVTPGNRMSISPGTRPSVSPGKSMSVTPEKRLTTPTPTPEKKT